MNRFNVTTFPELSVGDRFYVLGDPKKIVKEKIDVLTARVVGTGRLAVPGKRAQVVFLTSRMERLADEK